MIVNVILEAKLAGVVGTTEAGGASPAVPYCVWVVLGEIERSDDDDGYDLHPIQEWDSEAGVHRENARYLMGSLGYGDFTGLVRSSQAVKLIGPSTDLQSYLQLVKTLRDVFDTLGHQVCLLEVCDF